MQFCSDEDTDLRAIIKAWLNSSTHNPSPQLEGWIDDYFYKAKDWVLKCGERVVETTLVGLVFNGLSHLVGVTSKAEFACALVRGLGGNLPSETRANFAKEVLVHYEYIMWTDLTIDNKYYITILSPLNECYFLFLCVGVYLDT